jgi:hypothetical protein
MATVGLIIRIVALFTAKHNFTHEIAETKLEKHKLVNTGIYAYDSTVCLVSVPYLCMLLWFVFADLPPASCNFWLRM